jgi:hypothetical protein
MTRTVEWILAALAAGVTIFVTAAVTAAVGAAALILAAVALVAFAGFVAVARDDDGRSPRWGAVTWLVAGLLSAMVYLAGFSYGFFLLPAVLAFLGTAILADRRRRRPLAPHLVVYVGGILLCTLLIVLVNALRWV